jgi:putative membrane protein
MRVTGLSLAVFLAVMLTQIVVCAHGDEPHSISTPGALSAWDLGVLSCLLIIGTLYARGSLRLARRGVPGRRFDYIAFGIGWVTLVLCILPPLDSLAIQLFSIHMIQHELMMLVGAPLMIAGRPLPRCLSGLPEWARVAVAHALQGHVASKTWGVFTAPLVAWSLHGLAIWIWHMPALYEAAVGSEEIHALQHATFVGTAALFWWGMLYGRYGRAGYGAAVFYVFTTVVHTGILGAMVTFAGTPLYAIYAAPAAARGIDPLADQQLAGLLMWVPAGFVLTLLGLALFAAWLGEAERRARAAQDAKCKVHTLSGGAAS